MQFNEQGEELGDLVIRVLTEANGEYTDLADEGTRQHQDLVGRSNLDVEFSGVDGLTEFFKYIHGVESTLENREWDISAKSADDRVVEFATKLSRAISDIVIKHWRDVIDFSREKQKQAIADNIDMIHHNDKEIDKAIARGEVEQTTIPGV